MTDQTPAENPLESLSGDELQRVMRIAASTADAAATGETTEEKTEAVEEAIRDNAAREFPNLTDKQLQELAEKLAPILVAMSVGPLTDSLIEQLQELDVVFTPGQAPPAEAGTPEAAAEAEAEAAIIAPPVDPPRKLSLAERFQGSR